MGVELLIDGESQVVQLHAPTSAVRGHGRRIIPAVVEGANYKVIATTSGQATARIAPFDSVELDLAYILGE